MRREGLLISENRLGAVDATNVRIHVPQPLAVTGTSHLFSQRMETRPDIEARHGKRTVFIKSHDQS